MFNLKIHPDLGKLEKHRSPIFHPPLNPEPPPRFRAPFRRYPSGGRWVHGAATCVTRGWSMPWKRGRFLPWKRNLNGNIQTGVNLQLWCHKPVRGWTKASTRLFRVLHLPTFTPHLSHQTPFTSSTFYTTPGRQTKVDSSLWPQRTVPKLPSGTNGCQTLKTATLNTFYFCQKRPLCQPPPSPTPPPYSHFVRKVKLRLAYRLAFVITKLNIWNYRKFWIQIMFCTHIIWVDVAKCDGKKWCKAPVDSASRAKLAVVSKNFHMVTNPRL